MALSDGPTQSIPGATIILLRAVQMNGHQALNQIASNRWLATHMFMTSFSSTVNPQTQEDSNILKCNDSLANWKVEGVSLLAPSLHQCSHQGIIDHHILQMRDAVQSGVTTYSLTLSSNNNSCISQWCQLVNNQDHFPLILQLNDADTFSLSC